jgi:AcrR family transcriptional regulator
MPRSLTQTAIDDFRERLRKIAMELFAEVGRDGFNMRELGKRVGVSAMTPYRYFSDKDEILASIRTQAFNQLADRLNSALESHFASVEKLAMVTHAYVEFARQEPVHYRLMFDFSRPKENSYPEQEFQENRVRSAFTCLIRDLVEHNVLDGEPEPIAQVLWTAIHGAVALDLAGQPLIGSRELSNEMVRLLLAGYGASPALRRGEGKKRHPDFAQQQTRRRQSVQSDSALVVAAE